ncbi:CLUMA_CG017314, isoform A [Clunio marinus]|uniref:CLUMA_CG017314, isoform A n=1 Tax=Clunio marinus TaxID=568069 RepID=A0A1J1J019_9DIPT|nr:CLUMA_CG017314, isoform A [Clunio marinus]
MSEGFHSNICQSTDEIIIRADDNKTRLITEKIYCLRILKIQEKQEKKIMLVKTKSRLGLHSMKLD